jgi:drug/metabolite transporter (DMT)-like permease
MFSDRLLAPTALLLTMLFWGSQGAIVRSLAQALPPEDTLALRYAFITVILACALGLAGEWRIRREDWLRLAAAGLIGMAGYNISFNYGLAQVEAGIAGIIGATGPLIIALGAWLLLSERPSSGFYAGLALAFAGAGVLFWDDLARVGGTGIAGSGAALVFVSCICWSAYTLMCRPLFTRYSPFTVTAWTMIIATLPIMIDASAPPWRTAQILNARQWIELLYLVLGTGILGTLLWNYGTARLGSAAAGAFLYLIPVIAVAAGAVILGEAVTAAVVAGGALTLAGVAIAQFGPVRQTERA